MTEMEHKISLIEEQGISKTPVINRERLLRNLDLPIDHPADVVVITGCNSLLHPLRLMHLAKLLTLVPKAG